MFSIKCLIVIVKQLRSSSWSKLPQIWFAVKEVGHHYDYIWFFDSDATINPDFRNRSLSEALNEWDSSSDVFVKWGPSPKIASFTFFNNLPWRNDLPCAGVFFFRPNIGEKMIRDWWDYNLKSKNYLDFMEQDALWYMLEASPSYGFQFNKSVVSLLNVPQFPSVYVGCPFAFVHVIQTLSFQIFVRIYLLLIMLMTMRCFSD